MNFMKANTFENTLFDNPTFQFNIFDVWDGTTVSHWHNHMEFVLILSGHCILGVNEHRLECREGDVVYVPPGSLHSIECDKANYIAYVIGDSLFRELVLDQDVRGIMRLFDRVNFNESFVIRKNQSENLVEMLLAIKELYRQKKAHYKMMVKIEICRLLYTIIGENKFDLDTYRSNNPSIAYVKQALEYIDQHYSEKIVLKDIMGITNLSEQHFSRVFKAYTGRTFMEYLKLYRLDRVNWYLKYTELPITRIPEKVGFCNANYMARTYKDQFACTPRETRSGH